MKLFVKIILSVAAVYVLAWVAVAVYFSNAKNHKSVLESNLSDLFNREVSIASVETAWNGLSPVFQVNDLVVVGDTYEQPALSFNNLSAELDLWSVLRFWPKFTEFTIEEPNIEIIALENNRLQIAGFELDSNKTSSAKPQQVLSWLLQHDNAAWHNGSVTWRSKNGDIKNYSDISFLYQRQRQDRSFSIAMILDDGPLAFKVVSHGDLVKSNDWGASLEVLGDQGQFLASDDLSLVVSEGSGQLLLRSIDVHQICDFLQLTGIGGADNWLIKSQLDGQLSNLKFDFYGPLFGFSDWTLSADASNVMFDEVGDFPAMNNLNGFIKASPLGGEFGFDSQESEFSWPRWFEQSFKINQANGRFEWDLRSDDKIVIRLEDALFNDEVSSIKKLNVDIEIESSKNRIQSFAQFFKQDSLQDLEYRNGELINNAVENKFSLKNVFVDGSAEFDIPSLDKIAHYFPKDKRIKKFDSWWVSALQSGSVENGQISYQGKVSKDALYDGSAQLLGKASFADLTLDYGYQRDWPVLRDGNGTVKINNALVSIYPDEAWVEEDKIKQATIEISSLFRNDRALSINASMDSSLKNVFDFLLNGPLIKPSDENQQTNELPISIEEGAVSADVQIDIILNKMSDAKVKGSATVKNGRIILPQGVPINNVSADIEFTEESAQANNLHGNFLGGEIDAQLITTEAAQPPKLKFSGSGTANILDLEPWLGEHVLSCLDGGTQWQGSVTIDGTTVSVNVESDLVGVDIIAPEPLGKTPAQNRPMELGLVVGNGVERFLELNVDGIMRAKFLGDLNMDNQFFDRSIIKIGGDSADSIVVKEGINFDINDDDIDIDAWLDAVTLLAKLETKKKTANSDGGNNFFLNSMRSIKLKSANPKLIGRRFGEFELSAISNNGAEWVGSLSGDNIDGIIQAQPRATVPAYRFNLAKLIIAEGIKPKPELQPVDYSLSPASYPIIEMNVNSLMLVRKKLGRLQMRGEPSDGVWKLTNFELEHQGVITTGEGQWINDSEQGTMSSFNIKSTINEAGDALQELDLGGFLRKGDGSLTANVNWIGAPHEFDFSRLNGDFDLRISDGELVKIESNTGKLLGLLNFNAIARRLTLDFSDVFADGLGFDRMRYAGLFADGEAVMNDAYIFSPAVYVRMVGKLDLSKELVDMEIHLSPELGGNLTLLSALANPAAGAVVFLTQQIFKDEMRANSYKSYRANGKWSDFEVLEFKLSDELQTDSSSKNITEPTSGTLIN